jgi:zinc-ribbon domain
VSRLGHLLRRDRDKGRRGSAQEGEMPNTEATRSCPHCGKDVSRGATVCLYCERDLASVMPAGQFVQLFGSPDQSAQPVAETSTEADKNH